MSEDITAKNVWSTKQMIIIVAFAISITFSAALIYAEFVLHGSRINTIDDRLDKKIKVINSNTERIAEIEKHQ